MVNCCILYCKSSSQFGFIQKCFPKNQNLRDLWVQNINRPDWTPSKSSVICELHFSSDMWEIVNNRKILKAGAVPTIFPTPPYRKRFPGKIVISQRIKKNQMFYYVPNQNDELSISKYPINSTNQPSIVLECNSDNQKKLFCDISNRISDESSIPENPKNSTKQPATVLECDIKDQEQIQNRSAEKSTSKFGNSEDFEKLLSKQEEKIKSLQNRLKRVKEEKRKLESGQHKACDSILTTLFTEDQIHHLINKQRTENSKYSNWSNTTVEKALRLKFACGNSGYEELLRQGFPLPSLRTLNRKIEHIKSQPEISEEMLK